MVSMDYSGKNYIVTGGAGGIGGAVVDGIVSGGGHAVIVDINEAGARKYQEKYGEDKVTVAAVDLSNPADADLGGLGAFIAKQVPEEQTAVPIPEPETATLDVPVVDDVMQTAEGRVFGAKNETTRLVLKAKAPVWVRVEDAQGNVVMTQMLMKGDTYQVPDREGLVVIARDGGLLSYVIDGKEKGILGTPGEILVGRSLNLSTFEG